MNRVPRPKSHSSRRSSFVSGEQEGKGYRDRKEDDVTLHSPMLELAEQLNTNQIYQNGGGQDLIQRVLGQVAPEPDKYSVFC